VHVNAFGRQSTTGSDESIDAIGSLPDSIAMYMQALGDRGQPAAVLQIVPSSEAELSVMFGVVGLQRCELARYLLFDPAGVTISGIPG
jgi:hypothetical protein